MSVLSTSNSATKVLNAALTRLGVPEVTSFLDSSLAARTGNALFEDALESALCKYPWRFAQREIELQRVAEEAPPPYTGLYAIPGEMRLVRQVMIDDAPAEERGGFDVFERRVAVHLPDGTASVVTAIGTVMVGPESWPGYFRQPFIIYLAAQLAMPLTQDERTASWLEQRAERDLARAASRDSQGRTPRRLDVKTFIRARRLRGGA